MISLQHTRTKIPGDPSLRKHLHISQSSAPQLRAARPKRQELKFYGSEAAGFQGRNRISHLSACQLSLLAPFIPGTSLTLPNKHKGPHKSDSQRFMPLEGTAHQLAPAKSTPTSSAGGNLVCLHRASVPNAPESSQCCLLLLSSSPEPPTTLPVTGSSPGLPPWC